MYQPTLVHHLSTLSSSPYKTGALFTKLASLVIIYKVGKCVHYLQGWQYFRAPLYKGDKNSLSSYFEEASQTAP